MRIPGYLKLDERINSEHFRNQKTEMVEIHWNEYAKEREDERRERREGRED